MLGELRAFPVVVGLAKQLPFVSAPADRCYVPSGWSVWYAACPRCGEPVLKDPLFRKAHKDHHALVGR